MQTLFFGLFSSKQQSVHRVAYTSAAARKGRSADGVCLPRRPDRATVISKKTASIYRTTIPKRGLDIAGIASRILARISPTRDSANDLAIDNSDITAACSSSIMRTRAPCQVNTDSKALRGTTKSITRLENWKSAFFMDNFLSSNRPFVLNLERARPFRCRIKIHLS